MSPPVRAVAIARRQPLSRRHAGEGQAAPARAGLTLVEILIAMTLLTVGLLGMAKVAVGVSRNLGGGVNQSTAAAMAQSRFDSLSSVACANLGAGGATVGTSSYRGIAEHWRVTKGNDVRVITDSIWLRGRATAIVYSSVIPCRD